MKTIHKYHLPNDGTLLLTEGHSFMHFNIQNGLRTIWMEVDLERTTPVEYEFAVIGTGWEVPEDAQYYGTAFEGPFVWHLYQV
jgi:hypothetical protein